METCGRAAKRKTLYVMFNKVYVCGLDIIDEYALSISFNKVVEPYCSRT
jgi:hypothetical protein